MKKTLQEQIQSNRRASLILASLIVVLLGALGTAITGTYAPDYWWAGTLGSMALGLIVGLVANFSGPSIVLSIAGAREATHAQDQVLDNVVEEMAIAAGLPKPKIYVIQDDTMNAFATGRRPNEGVIAVTTGLLRKLDRDELQGVVAHEMSHIRNDDIRFMTSLALTAGLIPLLADMFVRMQWWGGLGGRRGRDRNSGDLSTIFAVVGLLLSVLAPLFARLLELAVSREREYLADASAAELTRYPEGLARALRKITLDPVPMQSFNRATQTMYIVKPRALKSRWAGLSSTHPEVEERIAALMSLAGSDPERFSRPVPPMPTGAIEAPPVVELPPILD